MTKRLIDILRVLARELIEKGYDADYALKKISIMDIDFLSLKDELLALELSRYIDDAELDTIRILLVYILIRETEIDMEEIYTFVFGMGRPIMWS